MQITIDTNNLSELDVNMLAFLAGMGEEAVTEETADEEPEAPAPTKAAAPAKKAAPKKAAAKAADPEPEPEEDLLGGDDEAPTLADATAAATALVADGKAATVKAALAEVGAKRVSELGADDIVPFLAALEAA